MYTPLPGDIGLTQIQGRVGRMIQVGQFLNGDGWSNTQHAFVVIEGNGLIEAEPNGARYGSIFDYRDRTVVYLRCPDEFREAVAYEATQLIGIGYSYADYFALAAHRFGAKTPKLQRYIENSGHMICSQMADTAAARGDWHLFTDGRWPGDVTPGDLDGYYHEQPYGKHFADL
jgi:hypothetical protein